MTDEDQGPVGAVERVLHQLVVGTTQAIRQHDSNRADNVARERDLQFQVAISGTATALPVWEEIPIEFEYALYYAPAARESSLEYPHFTYGSQTEPPVMIHATVKEWMRDETNGSIIGATVAVAATGEGAFNGVVHLNFQGYGALIENDEEDIVNQG